MAISGEQHGLQRGLGGPGHIAAQPSFKECKRELFSQKPFVLFQQKIVHIGLSWKAEKSSDLLYRKKWRFIHPVSNGKDALVKNDVKFS